MDVDRVLRDYLQEQQSMAGELDASYRILWGYISDMVLGGGKRLRPRLMIDTYLKYGGDKLEQVLPVAAAWEMLHVGLLIHDDIMDGDLIRRGKPTIEAIYNNRGVAILAGDLCLGASSDLVLNSRLSDHLKLKTLRFMHDIYSEVMGGQLLDIDPRRYDPLKVAQHKTASYSFVGPMLCGAMLAGASRKKLNKLEALAINQGIAFQLQNDLDDVEQDLAAGRHSSVIQAMEDLGGRQEGEAAIKQLLIRLRAPGGYQAE